MSKLAIMLFYLVLFSSCNSAEVGVYEQNDTFIQLDTLNLEKIKIKTH